MANPLRVFVSYSRKDDSHRQDLETHLALLKRQNVIASWSDRQIEAGAEWHEEISRQLETANIILLLISADFIDSDFIWGEELKRALERHEAGEARVIPIIVRPCDWHGAPFAKLQVLPKDALPITKWTNVDDAWTDVVGGIRRAANQLSDSPKA